ncbi:multifunctional transcriptional regulator/nicotinamide-nucleotide adenylyltransferase/ribosylnicotinamide kinase NadR [Bacillus sp. B-jedd]|uniref:multifunctional transcriptional regulator/nicotinamide-nucleotide adenylyltransferase/ribosylnicotinamide kinase NadR n=1 Tax=Bacillus sp. B-jedd TaxID=1476857 RepID=UPI0005156A01|nr:multifunctional transcriptional regulator/nicotinamide-nucleotide adenylyltransferase/ribosylnicotinamide kinase NadR [Bacillus sp. B-jedd]CEG26177.1 Trifunctional NAD biosynthesis/regulator protein NadR [Bacillus sp. B-jedd]
MTIGKVGMYGGKFYPVHMGHVAAMIRASTMVDELHVIVSYDDRFEREVILQDAKIPHIPYYIRLRWWTELTKQLPHVYVHAVEEIQTGQFTDWEKGAAAMKAAVGKEIDIVFSSEPAYSGYFDKLYPSAAHVVLDAGRDAYRISGKELRNEGPMKHWELLPDVVKPYFAKKVVIVGTESCGKSTLANNLATLYNTAYVEEYGRTFYDEIGGCEGITIEEDYPRIAFEHKNRESRELKRANKVLIIDTEAIVTQYFSIAYLGKRQPVLDEIAKLQNYDLWLFLEPDVEWVDDGTRSFGEQEVRERNNGILKDLFREHGVSYQIISGNYTERLEKAVRLIDELIRE